MAWDDPGFPSLIPRSVPEGRTGAEEWERCFDELSRYIG